MYNCILITGGCGFIASHFLNKLVKTYTEILFINIDKLNYCSNIKNIECSDKHNYIFFNLDVGDSDKIQEILIKYKVDIIVHFAAQTSVDYSFKDPLIFTYENIVSTHKLIEICKKYNKLKKFIYISTDEVYGENINNDYNESILNPTNPYSASKTATEFILKSYMKSYNIPLIITRSNNIYGPKQYPEKVIPKFILQLLNNKKCSIHGNGNTRRTFIYIDDIVDIYEILLFKGEIGEIYDINSDDEISVLDLAKKLICKLKNISNSISYIEYVDDRPFNDYRYLMRSNKIYEKFLWKPVIKFDDGIEKTIQWYKNNQTYWS